MSLEETKSVSEVVKWTDASNQLGTVRINFGENIILGEKKVAFWSWFFPDLKSYTFKTYSSGSYEITFRPKRMQ